MFCVSLFACGDTALLVAACGYDHNPLGWRSRTAVCELLIKGEADVNARNECAFMFEV